MHRKLDHVARPSCSHFREMNIDRTMPPRRVCLQCTAAILVRWKTCECCDHVFRSKREAECNLHEIAMKHMRVLESKRTILLVEGKL